MRSFLRNSGLLAGGVALGFVAAHIVNSTERGRAFFASVNDFVDDFTGAVREGYNARTEALYAAINDRAGA